MTTLLRAPALGVLVACLALGCAKGEPKKITIDGTVSYKGERLHSGILRAVGTNGSFATAPVRPDGTFTLTDVLPGEIQVGITEAPQSSSSSDGKSGAYVKSIPIPPKFQNPEKSGLKYTIAEDTRTLDIELK